jgi:signal transduction histidine kinase
MRKAKPRWNNSWLHSWGARVACIIIVLLFASSGVVAYSSVQAVHNQDQEVSQSRAVLIAIGLVYTDLNGAQAGVYNYVISGDPHYLDMFSQAQLDVNHEIVRLRALSSDTPTQESRVSRLQLLVPQEFGDLQTAVSLREHGKNEAAMRFVASGQGFQVAATNRQIVDAMQTTENQDLRQQLFQASSALQVTSRIILVVALIDLAMMAVIIALTRLTMKLRERLAEEKVQARAETELRVLQETNRQMDEFISIAGHEFRTPLTTLKASLQFALRRLRQFQPGNGSNGATRDNGSDGAAELFPLIDRAAQSTQRLERLANDLLDVSRIKTGKLVMRPVPLDLALLLSDCVEEQQQQYPRRTISVTVPLQTGSAVIADPDRIRQVISNYLTNAIKFSGEDQPISTCLHCEGEILRVCVRDEGPGLPSTEQDRIWERYHRAPEVEHSSGSSVGLGLGLYISKIIIVQHGGEVGVISEVGRGATFWFTLPSATAHPAAAELSTATFG